MSAYLPIASMSDGLEDQHSLPCLADPAGTSTVMTTILQLRTGSCVKTILYTTKDPAHDNGNTCKRKLLMPVPTILHVCQIQGNANTVPITLWDIKFRKGWRSIWASRLATCKNKTPRSKTEHNTLYGRHSIWASPVANDQKNKQPQD